MRGGPRSFRASRPRALRRVGAALARRNGFRTVTDEHDARTGGSGGTVDVREGKMNRRTFVSIAALFSLVNAVPGLIAPAAVASLYGVTVDPQTALAGQLLAGSYIGYGVLNWATRGCTDVALCRGLDAGNLVGWAISAVIWIYAASSGLTNAAGWFGAGTAVAFTLGWTYFAIADGRIEPRVVMAARR
jgi:hypothetical protein